MKLTKRKGFSDYFIFICVGILGTILLYGLIEFNDYLTNPYHKLDKQSINFNGIRYKINKDCELEIYKEYDFTTHRYYILIKKISFDNTEVK